MPKAKTPGNDGVEIHYELRGDAAGPPLLLVMGLGSQLVRWPEKFLAEFERRGFRLVLFDNRDVGLSTHLHEAGMPNLIEVLQATGAGKPADVAYTLDEMATDSVAVLDAVGIDRAHVLGVSMGGMVVQTMAIRHADRLASMTSIMSTTGNPEVPPPAPEVAAGLLNPPVETREAFIEQALETDRLIGTKVFPFEEDVFRERAGKAWDRGYDPAGVARQVAAIAAHGNRRDALTGVRVPSLVVHGTDDLLVRIEGGRDTAAAIPGAELVEIEGMAHDLPAPVQGRIAEAVEKLVERSR